MSPIDQKIEDTFSGYKITGWMGMTERFKRGIKANPQRAWHGWHRAWGMGHSVKPLFQRFLEAGDLSTENI
jgi:hypothetical protein